MLFLLATLVGCDEPEAPPEATPAPAAEPPAAPEPPPAPLTLNVTAGEISLVQVKNGDAEVPATISGVSGSLDISAGTNAGGELKIDVSTWASGDAGRDVNVKTHFFHAAEHAEATFALTSIDNLPRSPLAPGDVATGTAKGTLALYTGSVPVEAAIKLTRTETGYTLETAEDFTVSIDALKMGENLATLIKVCAHQSIDDSVKVGVKLTLDAP